MAQWHKHVIVNAMVVDTILTHDSFFRFDNSEKRETETQIHNVIILVFFSKFYINIFMISKNKLLL